MNIKTLTAPLVNIESAPRAGVKKDVRSEKSSERDSDGKRDPESQEEKHQYNEEEEQQALEHLKKIPGVVNHNLQVKSVREGDIIYFVIETLLGERVRRLTSSEAWRLVRAENSTGNLLNKAM